MSEERRDAVRSGMALVTFLKFLDSGKVQRALTRNISGVGICVVAEGVFQPGLQLGVEIKMPDRDVPIGFTGEVVWSQPVEESRKSYEQPKAEVGLKFVTIAPKDQALLRQYAMLYASPYEPPPDLV